MSHNDVPVELEGVALDADVLSTPSRTYQNVPHRATIKSVHFPHFDDGVARFNTGSLGGPARCVLDTQNKFRDHFVPDSGPHRYHFTFRLGPEIQESLREVVSIFRESREETHEHLPWEKKWSFVQNASTAGAIVAHHWHKSLYFSRKKPILILTDCVFGPMKRVFTEHLLDVRVLELKLLTDNDKARSLPQSRAEILNRFERELVSVVDEIAAITKELGETETFCCLEYIPCIPSFLLPVPDMISRLRDEIPGIKVFLDAAQVFMEEGMSFESELGDPDFAVINLYKWNFAPMGVAILYVGENIVNHVINSWEGGITDHVYGFYTGILDYSPYIAAARAAQFQKEWRSERDETARLFCRRNLLQAIETLTAGWGTGHIYSPDPDSLGPSMAMIPLPSTLPELVSRVCPGQTQSNTGLNLKEVLREEYGIDIQVVEMEGMGHFCRLSFAIFNTQEDVVRLRDAVLEIIDRSDRG